MKRRTSLPVIRLQVLVFLFVGLITSAVINPGGGTQPSTLKAFLAVIGGAGLIWVLNVIIVTVDSALRRLEALERKRPDE